jgi:hypothetical protein
MWIVIERGDIFEGDLADLGETFGLDVDGWTEDEVRAYCVENGWSVRFYERQAASWN